VFVCALSVNLTADPYSTSAHCDVHSLQYHYTSLLSGRGGKLVCVKLFVYKWVNRTKEKSLGHIIFHTEVDKLYKIILQYVE